MLYVSDIYKANLVWYILCEDKHRSQVGMSDE
jgi:hypothetical protein